MEKYQLWIDLMPRIIPVYALINVNHPLVLKLLSELNLAFHCASQREIAQALSTGVDQNRIFVTSSVKQFSDLAFAFSQNVCHITFDCDCELRKCKLWASRAKLLISIECRCSDCDDLEDGLRCAGHTLAPELLEHAKVLGMTVVGVAVNVIGDDKTAYYEAIKCTRKLFDHAEKLGYSFYMLNIRGGFPGVRKEDLIELAEVINKAVEVFFPSRDVTIYVEPGPFFIKSAFTLCSKIQSVKTKTYFLADEKHKKSSKLMYHINNGMLPLVDTSSFRDYYPIPIVIKQSPNLKEWLYKSDVYESSWMGSKLVVEDAYLPRAKLADWLVFKDMGYYSFKHFHYDIAGFPKYNVYVVASAFTLKFLRSIVPRLFH